MNQLDNMDLTRDKTCRDLCWMKKENKEIKKLVEFGDTLKEN